MGCSTLPVECSCLLPEPLVAVNHYNLDPKFPNDPNVDELDVTSWKDVRGIMWQREESVSTKKTDVIR